MGTQSTGGTDTAGPAKYRTEPLRHTLCKYISRSYNRDQNTRHEDVADIPNRFSLYYHQNVKTPKSSTEASTVPIGVAGEELQECRDRLKQPFSSDSIWNTAIGSNAVYEPAKLYNSKDTLPMDFHNDQDLFVVTDEDDPATEWINQGWWGPKDHCSIVTPVIPGPEPLPFPVNFTTASDGGRSLPGQSNNNAAAVLLPDRRTLVQMQPLYRCEPGSPILAKWGVDRGCPQTFPNTTDILGDGALGAHGGSGLSSIGGTIRMGELLPGAPPISHALKLELFGHLYYYGGHQLQPKTEENGGRTQYVWPATGCDTSWLQPPGSPHRYTGSLASLAPGALLALPPSSGAAVKVSTEVGRRIKQALMDYGGYIVDDTGQNSGAICMEAGVNEELRETYNISIAYPEGVRPGSAVYSDLLRIFQSLSVVTNNSPGNVGGGGTPRRPRAPPICDE